MVAAPVKAVDSSAQRPTSKLEHFAQYRKDRGQAARAQRAEVLAQTLAVYGAELIERHTPRLATEPAHWTKRIGVSGGGHWRNDRRTKLMIQLVR